MIENPVVIILDDEKDVTTVLSEYIMNQWPQAEVYGFTEVEDFIKCPRLQEADLFIIDIVLKGQVDGRQLVRGLPIECQYTPILFISGYTIDDHLFQGLDSLYIYDFISKPLSMISLLNRASLLLNFRFKYSEGVAGVERSLVALFDVTPFFALVLNADGVVKYCNRRLMDFLQVSPNEIIEVNWLKYIPPAYASLIREVKDGIIENPDQFKDYENPIMKKDGSTVSVRWFNTPFEGSESGMILSIGVPLSYRRSQDPSEFRAFWARELVRDKAMIRAFQMRVAKADDERELTPTAECSP